MSVASLLLEVTQRCDRACAHCYNVWRSDARYPRHELSRFELRRWADRAMESFSPRTVTLIGGEPLLCDGIHALVGHLTSKGVAVGLSTHGGLVDRAGARGLARAGLRAAEVSLCGARPDDGAAVSAGLETIALLQAEGIHCTASFVLARPFLARLVEGIRGAVAVGASGIAVHPLLEPFPGALPAELVPGTGEIVVAIAGLAEQSGRWGIPILFSYPIGDCRVSDGAGALFRAACACDGSRAVVDPLGNVRRCEADPHVVGNVFQDGPMVVAHSNRVPEACSECELRTCRRPCPFLARPGESWAAASPGDGCRVVDS